MKTRNKNAYTMIEAILIVLILGFFAMIAIPRLNLAAVSKNKAQTTARKIVNDLRLTRRYAVSNAATNNQGYALVTVGPDPYTGYNIQNKLDETTMYSHIFDSSVLCTGGQQFIFGPLGNLKTGCDTQLTVSAEGSIFTITIIPATGTVKCIEN